jgi:DNA (cytosine-5)-methyltransferase 1
MNVLNLYAGIGGNRKLWTDVDVTAVEIDPKIAKVYRKIFPKDKVIVDDAEKFIEDNFREYDFIWASPPCPSHSLMCNSQHKKKLPDMKLYGLIIFLSKWFKGKWVVENVKPYYEPLIKPHATIDRHIFWSNFSISKMSINKKKEWCIRRAQIPELCEQHNIDFSVFDCIKDVSEVHVGKKQFRRRQILRNCVRPEIGLHIFKCAFRDKQTVLS